MLSLHGIGACIVHIYRWPCPQLQAFPSYSWPLRLMQTCEAKFSVSSQGGPLKRMHCPSLQSRGVVSAPPSLKQAILHPYLRCVALFSSSRFALSALVTALLWSSTSVSVSRPWVVSDSCTVRKDARVSARHLAGLPLSAVLTHPSLTRHYPTL